MKKVSVKIFFVGVFFILLGIQSFSSNNLDGKDFSMFKVPKDSVFIIKYNNLIKRYKEKKYTEVLNESLLFYDNIKNKDSLNLITILIADIYDNTSNYKEALKYYKRSLKLLSLNNSLEKENNFYTNRLYAKTLLRIGSEYQKLFNKDSAKFYYKKLEDFSSFRNDILVYKAVSFGNLSGIYEQDSLFDKAKEYANKAIDIHKKINDKVNQSSALNNLGNIYLSLGEFDKSKEIYLDGIDLIKNDNSPNAVRFKAKLYYNLAWAMRNLKDYKAYDYQELSYEIEDGFRDKEVRMMIETVTAKNNIKDIKKEAENKRLKNQRTIRSIGIGAIIVILTLLYGLNYYKLRQKNLGLQLSQSQLVQHRNLERIKSESQVRILNATIDGKESERKQIAETLHDSVSALLSSANLHLQATRGLFDGNTPVEIDKTQKIIKEASQTIRDLSHTLVSSVLLKFGLKYAIKDMADKYSNSQIHIDTRIGDVRRYEQNFEIKVYNIIQEFVNNILKHSEAEKAMIYLDDIGGKLSLRISDDGIGFDKTKVVNKDGLGLNQIEARIQMMKGEFSIDSIRRNGTVIKVVLPVLEREQINRV